MKHIFLVNPEAGNKRAPRALIPKIRQACEEAGVEYDIHLTESAEEIIDYTKRRASGGGPIRFYACGGDGTLNSALCGMVTFSNAELGHVPCGTGNDFVRNFHNRPYFLDIRKQLAGTVEALDVIRAGDSYAMNMVNIGVDCDVVAEAGRLKNETMLKGSLAYGVAAIKVLLEGRTYRMRMEFDNGVTIDEELFLIGVANGSFCGGGFRSAPRASLSDGLLDVCAIRPVGGLEVVKLLASYRKGTHLDNPKYAPHIVYQTCKRLVIEAHEPVNVALDGEIVEFAKMEFDTLPQAVKFSVPDGASKVNA